MKPFSELPHIIQCLSIDDSEVTYGKLFKLMYAPVKRFSFCILNCREEAEEVAEDVMISLWRDRKTLLQISNIYVYSLVIAKNMSLNILKKKSRNNTVSLDQADVNIFLDDSNPEQLLITSELKQRIELAIQSLPPKCRLVFKLIKEDQLSYKQAAEILEISPKTVDAHLVLAMQKIGKVFKTEFYLS
jgi:RNA polymerase sigma-70 factor (family 1)